MGKNEETVTRTIAGPADVVYEVIADYKNHHPHILAAGQRFSSTFQLLLSPGLRKPHAESGG
jgi:hypothetical protein